MMKVISQTTGERALVSDEDFDTVSAFRWWTSATRSSGGGRYFFTQIKGKTVYMHRLILNAEAGIEVDHINGDASDNRRENLRLATRLQNCANRKGYTPVSGFRGVYPQAHGRTWQARISVNRKIINGGNYQNKEDAARRYDEMARLHFGEFAVQNFPHQDGSNQ